MEEYVARHMNGEDSFFIWQVEPSVIFGRNQQVESEVNLAYCREHHIQVFRRKSGGGCVYADGDNLMLSYVTEGDQVGVAFNRFVNMLLLVLRKMGVEAVGTSRNDVLIGDRKVCGTACYQLPGRCVVHSTMLYDTNMDHMLHAITPSAEKLQSKGVQSVRQRITLLKDHVTLTLDEVKDCIRKTLCTGERQLTATEIASIEQLEQGYLREEFVHLL
jgi:lipoic acid synthetase/lipoate-protein ligase A